MNNISEDGHIALISFGYFEGHFLEKISRGIQQEFHYPVLARESHTDMSEFFDPSRRQYNGNKLLNRVDELVSPGSVKTIGLFSVDLYIPILTFIFGQAYLNGRSAIASRFRLRNEHYGLVPDENLLIDRLAKEVIHELGHTFGLIHCHAPDCVMRSSTYVEDIDQKGSGLCLSCRGEMGKLP